MTKDCVFGARSYGKRRCSCFLIYVSTKMKRNAWHLSQFPLLVHLARKIYNFQSPLLRDPHLADCARFGLASSASKGQSLILRPSTSSSGLEQPSCYDCLVSSFVFIFSVSVRVPYEYHGLWWNILSAIWSYIINCTDYTAITSIIN